jgi:hypothetical protein
MNKDRNIRDIAVNNSGIIVDYIISQALDSLSQKKSFSGIGCLLKKDLVILPLLFSGEDDGKEISPEFNKRLLTALQDEITSGWAIAAGLCNKGKTELGGNSYSAIIITILHDLLENESITYTMPYVSITGKDNSELNEVVLLEESAIFHFNNSL